MTIPGESKAAIGKSKGRIRYYSPARDGHQTYTNTRRPSKAASTEI